MKFSIWTSYYMDLSPEEAILELEKNDIKYCELSDEHGEELLKRGNPAEIGNKFGEFARSHGVNVEQGHLWLKCPICSTENAVETLKTWIELYDAIGVKTAVLHCDEMQWNKEITNSELIQENIKQLSKLKEFLSDKKIIICLENLPVMLSKTRAFTYTIDELIYITKQLNDEHFAICLDTGHLNLSTNKNQVEFIKKAGKMLKALHIADNEGYDDQHLMPFGRGRVDFIAVTKALKEIGYTGPFNYEVPGERNCPLEIRSLKLQYMKQCFEYLMSL